MGKRLKRINGEYLFVLTTEDIEMYFFSPKTKSIVKLSPTKTTYQNKNLYKILAPNEGYYIIKGKDIFDVAFKGNVPYFAFIKTPYPDKIKAIDINQNEKDIKLNNIVSDIYYVDLSAIDYLGFFVVDDKIIGVISPFARIQNTCGSSIQGTTIETPQASTEVETSPRSSSTETPKITSTKEEPKINSSA